MVMYDNEFETKENKIQTKKKFEPQHTHKGPVVQKPISTNPGLH